MSFERQARGNGSSSVTRPALLLLRVIISADSCIRCFQLELWKCPCTWRFHTCVGSFWEGLRHKRCYRTQPFLAGQGKRMFGPLRPKKRFAQGGADSFCGNTPTDVSRVKNTRAWRHDIVFSSFLFVSICRRCCSLFWQIQRTRASNKMKNEGLLVYFSPRLFTLWIISSNIRKYRTENWTKVISKFENRPSFTLCRSLTSLRLKTRKASK